MFWIADHVQRLAFPSLRALCWQLLKSIRNNVVAFLPNFLVPFPMSPFAGFCRICARNAHLIVIPTAMLSQP